MTADGMGVVRRGEGERTGGACGVGYCRLLDLVLAALAPPGWAEEVPAEGQTARVDLPGRAAGFRTG
jgi:hypothetical protein